MVMWGELVVDNSDGVEIVGELAVENAVETQNLMAVVVVVAADNEKVVDTVKEVFFVADIVDTVETVKELVVVVETVKELAVVVELDGELVVGTCDACLMV